MKALNRRICIVLTAVCLTLAIVTVGRGGPKKSETEPAPAPTTQPAPVATTQPTTFSEPCTTRGAAAGKVMPAATGAAASKKPRRMWATSYRWAKAPELVVEQWLTDKPDTRGKYVLIEFWATWCPPCRRSIDLLNKFHRKYADELVVIGLSEESRADVLKLKNPKVEYFSAIDTQQRMKKEMGVFGIPHAIVLEPGGFVIWEGFPLLKDYELTEEIIEKILAVGRKIKAAQAAQAAQGAKTDGANASKSEPGRRM